VLVTRTAKELASPPLARRQAILDAPIDEASFRTAFEEMEVLHEIEVHEPPRLARLGATARIAFWNAERLKYPGPSVAMLASIGADALILCELDCGMARTGNRHTTADLARALDAGYVFGVEFVELGLGDLREQRQYAGEANEAGLHGAGLVSAARLDRPALVRLETSGRWFDGAFHERRVGGRIAVMAEIDLGGTPVLLVSAHYESHSDQDDRAAQTQVMLDAIDRHAPGRPVLIGGDFNTSTFALSEKRDPDFVRAVLAADPERLVRPEPYEPMFRVLQERGYEWSACNTPLAATQRMRPDGTPQPPFGRIDWFFSRGLRCTAPAVVPAVDDSGQAISDHEALAVTIAPA
jgi:endonuclease/exonuclease/phosphatase family metal-dependent hydrolase